MISGRKLSYPDFNQQWVDDVLSRYDGAPVAHSGQNSYELNPEDYKLLIDAVADGRELFQVRGVMLPPGNSIPYHQHPKWEVAIYMPHDSTANLILHKPDFLIKTQEGMCYEMEADRPHSVSINNDEVPRVTLALLFLPK